MTRTSRLVALVAVLAALGSTAGCGNPVSGLTGGDPVDRYCHALAADRARFADMMGQGSTSALLSSLPMLEDLAAKAPDDLSDEWQAFLAPLRGLVQALDEAGVKPSDYHDGKPPPGLSTAQQKAISDAADQLGGAQALEGAAGIDQQARDVCKINLGM